MCAQELFGATLSRQGGWKKITAHLPEPLDLFGKEVQRHRGGGEHVGFQVAFES